MNQLTTDRAAILALIDQQANLQPTTKHQYKKAIRAYLDTGASLTDHQALATYAGKLPKSSAAFLKAAIRLWSEGIVTQAQAGATPDNINVVLATQARVEALNKAIQVEASKGTKAHVWLSQAEVKRLLESCNGADLVCKRNRIVLGLLTGAGLRREELAGLSFDDIALLPSAGKFRTVLSVRGKGAKDRAIPINDRLAAALDEWRSITGPGLVARSLSKAGELGRSLSAVGIFHICRQAGQAIGKPELAPHDLRRTYAQLGYEAGIPITQISLLLGHGNVATTQRYLNLDLDLNTTVSDFIPF